MKGFVGEKADFEIDTFLYREPVKVFPDGLDVLAFGSEGDGTCEGILNSLKFVDVGLRDAIVKRVAIVKPARN